MAVRVQTEQKHSRSDLIFSMKMIFEKTWEYNDRTYLAFLDLEKAFDRVPRNK